MNEPITTDTSTEQTGFWFVSGIRHGAITRASSAEEAIRKSIDAGAVGDWESASADFIGVDMPEVIQV